MMIRNKMIGYIEIAAILKIYKLSQDYLQKMECSSLCLKEIKDEILDANAAIAKISNNKEI